MAQQNDPSPLAPTSDNADCYDTGAERVLLCPSYGPVHHCKLCGVEVSLVYRSFGRRDMVEIATGLHHRYHCTGHDRQVAAMLAAVNKPEYMPEKPQPKTPKRPIEPIRGIDIGTIDE